MPQEPLPSLYNIVPVPLPAVTSACAEPVQSGFVAVGAVDTLPLALLTVSVYEAVFVAYVVFDVSATVAVIVAEPACLIVTLPLVLTVATVVLFDAYVTVPSPVFVNAFVNAEFPYVLVTAVVP